MEMRELSLAEVKMVSGAGVDLSTAGATQDFTQHLKQLVDFANLMCPGNPEIFIATFAPLHDSFVNLLDSYGLDGKGTIASWNLGL